MVEIQYWILLNPSINSWNDLSLNFMFYYHSIKAACTRNEKYISIFETRYHVFEQSWKMKHQFIDYSLNKICLIVQ